MGCCEAVTVVHLQPQSLTQSSSPLSVLLLCHLSTFRIAVVTPMELGNVLVNLAARMQRMLGLPWS